MKLSRLADYVTIITGIFFLAGSINVLFSGLPAVQGMPPESATRASAVVVIVLLVILIFMCSTTHRVAKFLARNKGQLETCFLAGGSHIVGLVIFECVLVIVVETYLPIEDVALVNWTMPYGMGWLAVGGAAVYFLAEDRPLP